MENRVRYVTNAVRRPSVHATPLLREGGADGRERGLRRVVVAKKGVNNFFFRATFRFPKQLTTELKAPRRCLGWGGETRKTK